MTPYSQPEDRFFKVDATAAGWDVNAIERAFRRIYRTPSWPIFASTAIGVLQLPAEKVYAACGLAADRIERGREAAFAPGDEARRRIADHEAAERAEKRLKAEPEVAAPEPEVAE